MSVRRGKREVLKLHFCICVFAQIVVIVGGGVPPVEAAFIENLERRGMQGCRTAGTTPDGGGNAAWPRWVSESKIVPAHRKVVSCPACATVVGEKVRHAISPEFFVFPRLCVTIRPWCEEDLPVVTDEAVLVRLWTFCVEAWAPSHEDCRRGRGGL